MDLKIIGAGLAGLITASLFPRTRIFEAGKEGANVHRALLRFRSNAVGDAIGVPFRPVTVRKAIWDSNAGRRGDFAQPTPLLANRYAQKVIGKTADRSIWNLDSATRYIAPEDMIEMLTDRMADRIEYEVPFDFADKTNDEPIISTAPLSVSAQALRGSLLDELRAQEFRHQAIHVERYRIDRCDVYQTIYFPNHGDPVYRISITGDLLIIEYSPATTYLIDRDDKSHAEYASKQAIKLVGQAFGISSSQLHYIGKSSQRYGKIAPIDEGVRRAAIRALTEHHAIYSIGRFATWRNILLDDVLHDVAVVRRLINADSYTRAKIGA